MMTTKRREQRLQLVVLGVLLTLVTCLSQAAVSPPPLSPTLLQALQGNGSNSITCRQSIIRSAPSLQTLILYSLMHNSVAELTSLFVAHVHCHSSIYFGSLNYVVLGFHAMSVIVDMYSVIGRTRIT